MDNALVIDLAREDIGSLLGGGGEASLRRVNAEQALRQKLKDGEVRFGYWGDYRNDPLPDFLIIHDNELSDTNAWLAAFMPGLAPFSQWCRVLSTTAAERIALRVGQPTNEFFLAAWTGAILSEASGLVAKRPSGIKDAPGLIAISSSSYAASRAVYVWNDSALLGEIATRFDELTRRLGHGSRTIETKRLLPLWSLLGNLDGMDKVISDREILYPFREVLKQARKSGFDASTIRDMSKIVGSYFGVPEVEQCAFGPQSNRVIALDAVAQQMLKGPRSIAIDAVLGFSASLIDPGAAVLPELLRRYSDYAPLAAIWTGAFAGLWSPMRVMSDNGGLGRIVAKEIVKNNDLFSKPNSDISFEELLRWVGSGGDTRPRIRAMNANYLNVEIIDGVFLPFSYSSDGSRSEVRSYTPPTSSQRSLEFRNTELSDARSDNSSYSRPANISPLEMMAKRLDALEELVLSLSTRGTRSSTRSTKK